MVLLYGRAGRVAAKNGVLPFGQYATPLGPLPLDRAVAAALLKTGLFETMPLSVDAKEHSIELHAPFVAHIFRGQPVTLVPILVGALSPQAERTYGEVLAPYLDDPENFFVISSDFCHWGQRFDYIRYDEATPSIADSIAALDRRGMACIEAQDAAGFEQYLCATCNTICGRHAIGVLLHALPACATAFDLAFVQYAQSSAACGLQDSSVSYASAVLRPRG
jgi:AmmeMemoRadiSam system protein B